MHTASKKEMVPHVPAINYHLKSEVSITFHCQLCSTITSAGQYHDIIVYRDIYI